MKASQKRALEHWAFDKTGGETVVLHRVYGKDEDETMSNLMRSLMTAAGHDMQYIKTVQDEQTGMWSVLVKDNMQTKTITAQYDTEDDAVKSLYDDGYIYEVMSKDGETVLVEE